jgi:sarcosine oxidase subunit delta
MKTMNCPLNGPRNISEFACAGEVKTVPDPASATDAEWAEHVFLENNRRGIVREWWYHVPTAYWFIAERDTATDEILRTYPSAEVFRERVDFATRTEADR